jgi:hypothetical protein
MLPKTLRLFRAKGVGLLAVGEGVQEKIKAKGVVGPLGRAGNRVAANLWRRVRKQYEASIEPGKVKQMQTEAEKAVLAEVARINDLCVSGRILQVKCLGCGSVMVFCPTDTRLMMCSRDAGCSYLVERPPEQHTERSPTHAENLLA